MTDEARSSAAQGQRITAPYGSWASPITATPHRRGRHRPGGCRPRPVSCSGSRCGRSRTGATCSCGARPTARSPTSSPATSNARTLVHEYGGGIYALPPRRTAATACSSATSTTSGCTGRTCGDGGRAAGERRRRTGARRAPSRRRRRPSAPAATPTGASRPTAAARVRARAPRGRRRGRQRARRLPTDGVGRAARRRLRPRLLRGPAPQPRRAAAGLAQLGPPADAVGRHRAVGGGSAGRRQRSPRERLVAGGPHGVVLQPPWSPDGGCTSSSDRSGWWNLYASRDDRATTPTAPRSRARWHARRRVRQAPVGLRPAALRLPRRRAHRRPASAEDGVDHLGRHRRPAPGRRAVPCELTTFSSLRRARATTVAVTRRRAARPPRSRSSTPAAARREVAAAGRRRRPRLPAGAASPSRSRRPTRQARSTPAYISRPEAIGFPTERRPHARTPSTTRRRTRTSPRRRASGRR